MHFVDLPADTVWEDELFRYLPAGRY